jgi:hypothetical protein
MSVPPGHFLVVFFRSDSSVPRDQRVRYGALLLFSF